MRVCVAHVLKGVAAQWDRSEAAKAWKEDTTEGDRKVLKKYIGMFLRKLKDESFPEKDKEVLKRFAKGFLSFLRSL